MIGKGLAAVIIALLLTACVQVMRNSTGPDLAPKPAGTLRLASYNVHYIITQKATGPWSVADWDRRRTPLDLAFKSLDADIIGFQEMESFAHGVTDAPNLANNPDYAAAAVGPYSEFPSTQPILYRKSALTLLDQGWFFFSDTPDEIYSRTFNGSFPAFASWALFADPDGRRFRVINVHFEYKSSSNRLKSAELVAERIEPWAGETLFLIGDLNARLGSKTVGILEDTGFTFAPVTGSTYHLNKGLNLFGAIDHLAARGASLIGAPMVVRQKFAGEWPTDHYPVVGDFLIK